MDHVSVSGMGVIPASWTPELAVIFCLMVVVASYPTLAREEGGRAIRSLFGAVTAGFGPWSTPHTGLPTLLAEPFALGIAVIMLFVLGLSLAGYLVYARFALKSRELEESEQRHSSLFLHHPDTVYSADLRGRITAVNPAAEVLSGYPAAELVGRISGDLIVPEERTEAARRFALAAGGEAQTYETAITDRDGRRIEVGVTMLPTVVGGVIRGIYGIMKDVTGRKRAEAALLGRNDHLAALHETARDLMVRSGTEEMLYSIVFCAARLVRARSGCAFLIEPRGEEMGARAAVGVYARRAGGHTVRRGQGLGGRVWESGEPIVVNDYWSWEGRRSWPGKDDVEDRPSAAVAMPIKSGGEVVGVMALAYEDGGASGDEEVAVLENFAEFSAVALHNARLYDAAERQVRDLSRYNRNLFEVNLDGLAALNLMGGLEDANPAMADLVNLTRLALLKTGHPPSP